MTGQKVTENDSVSSVPDEAAMRSAESVHAPIQTFTITRKGGEMENVNSCFVEFTPHHVIFRDSAGRIDYGLHASELIDIVQSDHS